MRSSKALNDSRSIDKGHHQQPQIASHYSKLLGTAKMPFSTLNMSSEAVLRECAFAPRPTSWQEADLAIDHLMDEVGKKISVIEALKKVPEYNIHYSVELSLIVNKMKIFTKDDRLDEQFLTADAEEPVSATQTSSLSYPRLATLGLSRIRLVYARERQLQAVASTAPSLLPRR
jgi:hypothetical protein